MTVRPNAGAAVAGPAIAVALAPPLATFGILLVRGYDHLARGALLLFLTNLIGIVIAAVAVSVVTGFTAHGRISRGQAAAVTVTLLAMLAVAYPLANTSVNTLRLSSDEAKIRDVLLPEFRASGLGIQSLVVIRDHRTIVASADVAGLRDARTGTHRPARSSRSCDRPLDSEGRIHGSG